MISRHDLIDFSGLSEAVISAISMHQRLPEPVAAAYGNHLMSVDGGASQIRGMIEACIGRARQVRYARLVQEFEAALDGFELTHDAEQTLH